MSQKGELTVTMEELQDMLLQGKIDRSQFIGVLISNFGEAEVRKILDESKEDCHSKKLLLDPNSSNIFDLPKKTFNQIISESLKQRMTKQHDRKTE